MNRKDFFKKIGLTSLAIAIAPKLLLPENKEEIVRGKIWDSVKHSNVYNGYENEFHPHQSEIIWLMGQIEKNLLVKVKNPKIFLVGDIVIMDNDNRKFYIFHKTKKTNGLASELLVLRTIAEKPIKNYSKNNKYLRKIGSRELNFKEN